ncbi:MAG TPA: carbohydrate-binding module family 20 domain-containing protein [Cellvibrio sp.]|nr:carbohydrate-binding module family 20 domain-containing protein [Cellvibrio sp.]
MKIQHLLSALVCMTCASVHAVTDRSTIRIQDNGTEFPYYDTRNIAMSDDGRFVVESISGGNASTLGTVSLTDMQTRKTSYLKNNQGVLLSQSQVFLAMSPSGRYIAIRPSDMTNSNFGPEKQSLYLYDAASGTLDPVEKSYNGSALQNCTTASAIIGSSLHNWGKDSFAGDKFLFFYSSCSNLVQGDTNGVADIFVYNLESKTIELVTRNPATNQSFAGESLNPRVSADGNIVAFASRARDIVNFTCHPVYESESPSRYHVYVLNRSTGAYLNINYCHGGNVSIKQLAYDVADDGSKVHFLGKTHHDHDALISLTVKTGVITESDLAYSYLSPLETTKDGSTILFRSQGYYDNSGVYHSTFNGNAPNAYGLLNVNTGVHTLLSTHKTTGDVWLGFSQYHATLSSNANIITFGTSGTLIQELLNTTATSGESSAYYYIHPSFTKNSKWVTLRGTFNGWKHYGGAMKLVANNLWEAEITQTQSGSFKFDAAGDWSVNYGDNNADGIAGSNEANINLSQGAGRYKITFNDQTKQYTVKKIVDVTFNCFNGVVTPDQSVYVVGNIAELANWVTANAIKLTPTTNYTWVGKVTVPANINIEWKCVKIKDGFPNTNLEWEPGANNQFNSGSTQTSDGHF